MLIDIILLILTLLFSYLYLSRNAELTSLQKYSANLENELLQQQIKFEELSQHNHMQSYNNEQLLSEKQGILDPLTGLPTIAVFEDRLLQNLNLSRRFGKTFGLLMLEFEDIVETIKDIDEETGFAIIRDISNVLNQTIRKVDTVTRGKNNIFLLMLPQLSQPETAAYVVNRLVKVLEKQITVNDITIHLKPNFGIAVFPNDGDTMESLLDNAYSALQQSKESAANAYQFHNLALQEKSNRLNAIATFFHDHAFLQHMQVYAHPQINVHTSKTEGVKVVPFLNHHELGTVSLQEIETTADRENKSLDVLIWLFEKAIDQYQVWQQQGFSPKRISINITAKQIQHDNFVTQLKRILVAKQFDAKLLAFEIAAKTFSDNATTLQTAFNKIGELGIQTSISVYSLGHLALQKITHLPINYLKVDPSLIETLSTYTDNEHILSALLDLSKTMDLKIIAEGVSEEKQKQILQRLGFELMEGNLFGMSKPVEEFTHIKD